ncbi:hypothetical protein BDV26DRAFT_262030 [Aspergillus bertholletiae]|uniref:Uncharacterized protein n=1 Tax=Aspergillus bertholletiae TaxID=1226010 RepID=A0A5N7B917_9EURO|nr:hypothetical protein BDV26DRAFT_262030 [Aspergillus bertholletiae]
MPMSNLSLADSMPFQDLSTRPACSVNILALFTFLFRYYPWFDTLHFSFFLRNL